MRLRAFTFSRLGRALDASCREVIGHGPKKGIVFHHIPKCAGSSISQAIRAVYPPWQHRDIDASGTVEVVQVLDFGGVPGTPFDVSNEGWETIHELRCRLLYLHLRRGARAVTGHVAYYPQIQEAFGNRYLFATVLRDPVDRFLSQYLYSSRSRSYDRVDMPLNRSSIDKFGPIWGTAIAQFLGRALRRRSTPLEQIVERAKRGWKA